MNPSMHFFEVVRGDDGKPQLRSVTVDQLSVNVVAQAISVVRGHIKREDDDLTSRIAAGSAAKLIFDHKAYAAHGYTKDGFCRHEYGKAARTIDSYVAASETYEDIGGLDCRNQPTSVNQLDALNKVVRVRRQEVWQQGFSGSAVPSGEVLLQLAKEMGALIPKKTKEVEATASTELPCSTLLEAIEMAAAMEKARGAQPAAWSKMREFLQVLSQQDGGVAPKPKRASKTKLLPDAKGQVLMFVEQLVPKTDELDIPQLG